MTRENLLPSGKEVHSKFLNSGPSFPQFDIECIEPENEGLNEDTDYSPPSMSSCSSSSLDDEGSFEKVSEEYIITTVKSRRGREKKTELEGFLVGTEIDTLPYLMKDDAEDKSIPLMNVSSIPHNELAHSNAPQNNMEEERVEAIEEVCEEILNNLVEQVDQPEYNEVMDCEVSENRGSRWRRRNPQKWQCNMEKRKRSQCLPYEGKKKLRPAKTPKTINCQKCRFHCSKYFTEAQRENICAFYWGLDDFKRQKDFILGQVTLQAPARRRPREEGAPRSNSMSYRFKVNGDDVRMCQKFFLSTLCISKDVVYNALMHKGEYGSYVGEDKRGKRAPANKTIVKKHIESFHAVDSHYSRSSSRRRYLDATLSIEKMYELYLEEFKKEYEDRPQDEEPDRAEEAKSPRPVFLFIYKRVFGTEYNLSFYHPKKDRCQTCENYHNGSQDEKAMLQENYDNHQLRKDDCNAAKSLDKIFRHMWGAK
ncbi:unnamed protein product, partial [Iphiclides podalirius]